MILLVTNIRVINWTQCPVLLFLLLCHLSVLPPDAPQVSIIGYDNNWYVGRTNVVLTCQATGNPVPTSVLWKTWVPEHLFFCIVDSLSVSLSQQHLLPSLFLVSFSLIFFSFTLRSQVHNPHRAVISAFIIATTALHSDYGDSRIISHNGLCDSRFNPRIMRNTIWLLLSLFFL